MKILSNPIKIFASYKVLFGQAHHYFFNDFTKLSQQSQKLIHLLSNSNRVRLWSLEQLSDATRHSNIHQMSSKSFETSSQPINIVVNKHFSSLQEDPDVAQKSNKAKKQDVNKIKKYRNLIEDLNGSKNWVFLPNFYNISKRHQATNYNDLFLIIGDFNSYFMNFYLKKPFITLEQLCAIFPQKVPLSYRSRESIEKTRESVQHRLSKVNKPISLKQEPKFAEIIISHDRIKMWDEAYQIMLDELPIKISVPFHCAQKEQSFYKLSLNDLMEGFKTSHKIIHPNIPLQIDQQNAQEFIQEAIRLLNSNSKNLLKSKYEVVVMDKELAQKSFMIELK